MPATVQVSVESEGSWAKCIKQGALRLGIGLIIGGAASFFLMSETPIVIGSGIGSIWAVANCKSQFKRKPVKWPEEECSCTEEVEIEYDCSCPDDTFEEEEKMPPSECTCFDEEPAEACSTQEETFSKCAKYQTKEATKTRTAESECDYSCSGMQ